MTAYYNEHDPYAAQWLRNLIAAGHIAPGDVDERDIQDVRPDDLRPYRQCHFFAGIGVWSSALRRAGWDDSSRVWTGSCPCQPFSAAGKGAGFNDERHLWPAWFHLINMVEPTTLFGEQVASPDGLSWFDLVATDLESADYSTRAVDLCAAGAQAFQIRQRLWWVARAHPPQWRTDLAARDERDRPKARWIEGTSNAERRGVAGGVARADSGNTGPIRHVFGQNGQTQSRSDVDWIYCRDDKWRPIEPGTFPLAYGATSRVGKLRAYGNTIHLETATRFILAACDAELTP